MLNGKYHTPTERVVRLGYGFHAILGVVGFVFGFISGQLFVGPMSVGFIVGVVCATAMILFALAQMENPVASLMDWRGDKIADDEGVTEALARLYPLSMACTHCQKSINFALPWSCGHCKYPHDWWRNGTLMQGCCNSDCYPREIGSPVDAQAAFQCPHCAQHIVLNPEIYAAEKSHKQPYKGVARFIGDESMPVLKGSTKAKGIVETIFEERGL